ncbi:MerR family transcriptional regulator [Actinopolymorpha sp. B17G11]|uniref:MerR family transcriptional regulator n=1 Tax=unclassified Actinopolymorpha TaxID=2627063 RepID=UPI0032D8CA89
MSADEPPAGSTNHVPTGEDVSPRGDQGLYPISVVTDLTGIDSQQLRRWERAGLLKPPRSAGGTRRYSNNDLARLRHISRLASRGLNQPGIAVVLHLEDQLQQLRSENDHLREQLSRTRRR